MNLRGLMDWGIVKKELIKGERKEYFVAEKDVWFLFKQITKERRKRENPTPRIQKSRVQKRKRKKWSFI